jgi:chaperonin cofactor prefoldin|tara:strand:+ start:175 stop:417 length:243 start_codon:yes stop_codon:yes gene_type:complete
MSKKVEKITSEELEAIQNLVKQINNGQSQIGQIETQKHTILHQIAEVQKGLKDFQDKLEKEYGKVNVNIQDGTITPIEDE